MFHTFIYTIFSLMECSLLPTHNLWTFIQFTILLYQNNYRRRNAVEKHLSHVLQSKLLFSDNVPVFQTAFSNPYPEHKYLSAGDRQCVNSQAVFPSSSRRWCNKWPYRGRWEPSNGGALVIQAVIHRAYIQHFIDGNCTNRLPWGLNIQYNHLSVYINK